MMQRMFAILGIGCGSAAPHATPPIANATPAASHPQLTLREPWPAQAEGGDIVARVPAGPFPDLSAVCAALDRKPSEDRFEGCHTREDDELVGGSIGSIGSIVRIGSVAAWEPVAHDDVPSARLEYLAVQTRAGWFVLPQLGDTGNRYSSLAIEARREAGAVVISYGYELATAGRFASDTEDGIIVCKPAGGAVTCTPKIATRRFTMHLETDQPDWPTAASVELACTATYANDAITFAPMPPPEGEDPSWTAEAAAGCSGTRAVR